MRGSLFVLLASVAAASRAHGQDRLWSAEGDQARSWLGDGVEVIGDLNGDGTLDVAATAPYHTLGGILRILDGKSGATLFDIGPNDFGLYPYASRFADVDGDGVEEVFLGRYVGAYFVFSVASLQPKSVHYDVGGIGFPIRAGDVNHDGVEDYAVAAKDKVSGLGEVRIGSGKDGTLLLTLAPTGRSSSFGSWLASAGDWNADGNPDLATTDTAPGGSLGNVSIFSLKDGSLLTAIRGPRPGGSYGRAFDQVGDLDHDGIVDFVWSNSDDTVGPKIYAGTVHVLSGATLSELATFKGNAKYQFLHFVAAAGDVNGDGCGDFALGTGDYWQLSPIFWYYSGRTFGRLYAIQTEDIDDWTRVTRGADLDGDGLADFVAGRPLAPGITSPTSATNGRVTVDRGRRVFLAATPAVRNRFWSLGMPVAVENVTFYFHHAEFQPGTLVTLNLVEVDGSSTQTLLAKGVANAAGEWDTTVVLLPPDTSKHTYGVQAVGTDRFGQPVTTSIERVAYK